MLIIKRLNFISNSNKKLKFILYFIFISISIYLSIPKLLNFSVESIRENLKNNNNMNIDNISKVSYKIFPTPRLSILNSNFIIGEGAAEVKNSKLEIILYLHQILNFREINYKKILINEGHLKISIDKINQLLKIINKNKKKLIFKKNNLIFLKKEKVFFEINEAIIEQKKNKDSFFLNISGKFLNNKIFIKLKTVSKNKNYLTLKMPGLDIATKVFFEKNKFDDTSGFFNLEVFNNFLKFNFINGDSIKLSDGFIRSKLVNSSLEGEITFKPNFFSRLNFTTSNLNMEKIFPLIQKTYFLDNSKNLSLVKKINGVFNFKSKFEGRITSKNGEILFEDFKVGKKKSISFNAKIDEIGKKGKIQFNLIKTQRYKKNLSKKIEIVGFLIPEKTKVIFKKLIVDDKKLSVEKTKEYENVFKDKLVQDSLANIFDIAKINKFLKNIF